MSAQSPHPSYFGVRRLVYTELQRAAAFALATPPPIRNSKSPAEPDAHSPYFPSVQYPGPTRIEWCHAIGNAHHTSAPKIACPSASGKIFRSRANSHAIAAPPTNVSGTSTGFGQCSAANKTPPSSAAGTGFPNAASKRFVKNEFSPTCCNTQNAKYPTNFRGSLKCVGNRCSIPKNNPAPQTAALAPAKNPHAFRVAAQRLSPRHPIVFGVSCRSKKLATSHTTNTHQVAGSSACPRQMYHPTYATNPNASIRQESRCALQFTVNSPPRIRFRRAAFRASSARFHTASQFPSPTPSPAPGIPSNRNPGIHDW